MTNTYSKIYIHVIFSVKDQKQVIDINWVDGLNFYINGIVKNNGQQLLAINGFKEHIHLLLCIKPTCNLSELIKHIKTNSTKWINSKRFLKDKFHWQDGYAEFSCSHSQVEKVLSYLKNQKEKHKMLTYQDEYRAFLKKFEIEFEEKYLF